MTADELAVKLLDILKAYPPESQSRIGAVSALLQREVLDKLPDEQTINDILGGCNTEETRGDNLAILLCGYYTDHPDHPDDSPETENGWSEWAERKANKTIDLLSRAVGTRIEEALV